MRRTSLDELPQFVNVLQGRMSIVGPRPHAVAHNEMYRQLIKAYMVRHKVKPGITGWAQVNGLRGETDTVDKMQPASNTTWNTCATGRWFDLDICRSSSPCAPSSLAIGLGPRFDRWYVGLTQDFTREYVFGTATGERTAPT
jgi:hypothetical protein